MTVSSDVEKADAGCQGGAVRQVMDGAWQWFCWEWKSGEGEIALALEADRLKLSECRLLPDNQPETDHTINLNLLRAPPMYILAQ
ncbi:hypothetical protein TNCV_2269691 [Trichonephila clavipes]|nr:hypothetical protein TNCV_2269691 [Trichonephila clavipes]